MLKEDDAIDQSVSVSESPEDKRDRRLQRILRASTIRVGLSKNSGQAISIESEYNSS